MSELAIQELPEALLKTLDFAIVADFSGSMGDPSHRFPDRSRIEEVEEICVSAAREAQAYDDDGITVIAFSSHVNVTDGVTAENVRQIFQEQKPHGGTNLTAALQEVVKKRAASQKNMVAVIYTDGRPDDEASVIRTLDDAAKKYGRPGISFVFVQVGNDAHATNFLKVLDSGLPSKVDVVATVKAEDAGDYTLAQLSYLGQNA